MADSTQFFFGCFFPSISEKVYRRENEVSIVPCDVVVHHIYNKNKELQNMNLTQLMQQGLA
jgi:hypothetical protein